MKNDIRYCAENMINVGNGWVNLATGNFEEFRGKTDNLFNTGVNYDQYADCPKWEQFLNEITAGDADMQARLLRMAGYCLTGSVREQCAFVLHGVGFNGKSVFTSILRALAGEYANNISFGALELKDKRWRETFAALLENDRVVVADESQLDTSAKFSDALGWLCQDDYISGRLPYQNYTFFYPQFKLVMATNQPIEKMEFKDKARLHIRHIHFPVVITHDQHNPRLLQELKAELPGIFNCVLQGAIDWYRFGLPDGMQLY